MIRPHSRSRRHRVGSGFSRTINGFSRTILVVALIGLAVTAHAQRPVTTTFEPALKMPEALEPFLAQLEPGHDAFPAERDAQAIEARLATLGAWLTAAAVEPSTPPPAVLAAGFRGSTLLAPATATGKAPLTIARTTGPGDPTLDAGAFAAELQRLVADMRKVTVTAFLVTGIESDAAGGTGTEIRYEIVGLGRDAWRIAHVGRAQLSWTRQASDWQLTRWTRVSHTTSRAEAPLVTEVTGAAVGPIESFARQLTIPLDEWTATFDAVLTRDSNGHHGVSVGDADGDGVEDLYVAQPGGLPNRLYRGKGDGTFEDITERSGAGLLDDTAHSLFADVDNDGDQDLVLATGVQPLLLANDGTGRFTHVERAFAFMRPLEGVLTGLAMADYDRDGFLDVYLCVYSYFFGAGEDKAGTPMPYHDARNGPPGVLFRNDGQGRFVDVTSAAGLDEGNDRYHFAASWADYDEDGWPDLLVANDFGTKNLYRNLGRQPDGRVRFRDVAGEAGVLDHGAGMSAAFFDYDNDGRLDIYLGNMWAAPGLRVTGLPAFMPDAPADVRTLYQRHARGNSLFRNRGDGRFDDRSIEANASMGRWAWASDAVDLDGDGWQDLYVANGMLSRGDAGPDLESYFWRQVVARSPLTRVTGTPYDEAWRAINQLLLHGSIASRQRNVFLRNDGAGGFDDVSGAVGLDLDQDGRSFAVLDLDRDGDPDLVVMAARQAPQLRLFRNDHPPRAALAIRLAGTTSNRDAIGARVRIETDTLRGVKLVQAGSGFLSQHSRELLFGLGDSRTVKRLIVEWPSGETQTFSDLPIDTRFRLTEGGTLEREPIVKRAPASTSAPALPRAPSAPAATWLYEPFPVPDFTAADLAGATRSLAALKGRPSLLLFWRTDAEGGMAALDALGRGSAALREAGVTPLAIALDDPAAAARVRAAAPQTVPVVHATPELGITWAIVHRHLFMNRQPLRLPTALLLDADGRIVRLYRQRVDVAAIVADAKAGAASPEERLARALPYRGRFHTQVPQRNYLPFGRELLDQGLEAEAIVAFERAAQAKPAPSTLYRLGTLLSRTGERSRARAAFERALTLDPELAEAHNDLGALLAQDGDLEGAIARFRLALAATPDYPDALNNLGYALLLTGQEAEARELYEKALQLQPDFPEALNNLGLLVGRAGDLAGAEQYFRKALAHRRDYGDAANNLALVLVARGDTAGAIVLLEELLRSTPGFEAAYLTLAKIHLSAGRVPEGLAALEGLLQRNPTHPIGLALAREYRPK